MSDQEVTEHIEQHQDNVTPEVVQQIEKIQQKQIQSFASILQTSLFQFTASLAQLLINQNSKSLAEEDQEVTGKSRKSAKTYVERSEDEPTCSKYVDRFVGSSG